MAKELEDADVTREEAANRLEELAAGLRGDDSFDVTINNRTIHLSPPDDLALEVGVRESSSILRGEREGITIKLDWKPE
jgi:amphi-Trp domain-containing protein